MSDHITEQKFPLTKQQQGLWIEWKLHPDNTSYNTCVKVKLKGDINKDQLGQALKDIVQYFDSLKVYFIEEAGIPYQCVKSEGVYFLDYEDISIEGQIETPELAQQGLNFLSKTLNTPIDLKTFPIVRASLMKVANQTYYFIGMVPHMISDGRSAVLFLESLSIAYNYGYQGLRDAYDATSKSWSDFHQDERNLFDEEKYKLSKQHWQQRLAGANHYFDYSYGRKNNAKDDKQGHRVYFDIPAELAKGLKAHTSKNRTTLFNVMVCAFGIFIHRYFGLKDILIGFPISIRPPGYKHLFGFFVNIVPIRVDLSGDPSYQELLGRVSKSRKEDKRHQKFPALDIVNAVRENVDDFDGQLFNLSMAQTVSRLFNLELDGVETQPLESEYNDVNDDLSLSYELLEDGIGLWFEYRTSMFDMDFINQGIKHIRQILEQMVNASDTKLSQFNLLNDQQRNELITFANGRLQNTNSCLNEKHPKSNLVDLFEYQVSKSPNAMALKFANEQMSYLQLNHVVNQLARQLLDLGISSNQKIAICLNRGPSLIISLLAVVKSGCSYIPIAPDYPKQRLQFIIDDTGCNFIICEEGTATLCSSIDVRQLNFNSSANQRYTLDNSNLGLQIRGNDLAYIIYTSGSTGTPKGVPINHSNLVPRLNCLQQEIALTESDIMLQNTDFSFDVSVAEIFWPLTSGASLYLVEQHESKLPNRLVEIIQQHKVTTTCMVPSLLNAILSATDDIHSLSSLKHLLAAGEALSPLTVELFYQLSHGKLFNFYGPTEATIYSTFYYCDPADTLAVIPIGKPLKDTQTYILDEQHQLQAKGVVGELYLAGKGISSGYINRSELNGTTFIDNPFDNDSSSKLYKTGDKARYLTDGTIDFLGRLDQQVKIRGYRIEISDIETNISTAEYITDNAVVVEHTSDNLQRLIAYFTRSDKSDDTNSFIDKLKQYLNERIPSYMIPALFIELKSIPRGQSGKLLKDKLPSASSHLKGPTRYVAPETDIEKRLAVIWSEILRLPIKKIGLHDSFFELGGDSLMAFQFASAAESESLYFDTASLFESRTIGELAELISTSKPANISQQPIDGEFPLTARQYKFFDDDFINADHWNRQFSFDVEKNISVKSLNKAFAQILEHHDALRVYFEKKYNGEWVQIIKPITNVNQTVKVHDLINEDRASQKQSMNDLINLAHKDIRLDCAPLIKIHYFKLGKKSGHLIIVCHHLLLDMVSSRIIFEDLVKCYEYLRRGLSYKLSDKTSSLKEWTQYLQRYSVEHDFSQALNYWGDFPLLSQPPLTTKNSFNNKNNTESSAKTITFTLADDLTEKLLKDIPINRGYKIQDLLLVALLRTTKNWTENDNLTVNICGHGRNANQPDINLSRTVGWLNTVFPVKLNAADIDISNSEQLVAQVVEQIAQVPDNNMDYNILRYINKDPTIRQHKSPDIFFNYVGQIDAIIPDNISFKPSLGVQGIAEIDGDNHLCYLLYFEAGVTAGKLNIRLSYSKDAFAEDVIEKLYKNLITAIEQITLSLSSNLSQ